jgi:hypothetical protein
LSLSPRNNLLQKCREGLHKDKVVGRFLEPYVSGCSGLPITIANVHTENCFQKLGLEICQNPEKSKPNLSHMLYFSSNKSLRGKG